MEGMNHPHQVRNQNSQHSQNDHVAPQNHAPRHSAPEPESRKWYHPSLESITALGLVIIASILVVLAIAGSAFSNGSSSSTMNLVKDNQYQAVFLSNGQVYFGKIVGSDNQTLVLEDIFYLQVEQQLQPEQVDSEDGSPQVSLAKLGNELHGPEDQMFISMKEVVFWENLRDDGDVVTAINQFNDSSNGEQAPMNEDSSEAIQGGTPNPESVEDTQDTEELEQE